jgi:hypothetical protein
VWAATETTFIAPDVLRLGHDKTRRLEDGETVVLAFDGSERRDETWLTACSLDGFIEPLARWGRPQGAGDSWRVPRPQVHRAIEEAFDRFNVLELAFDPPGWYSEGDERASTYGSVVVEFETKQATRFAPACERTRTGLNNGELTFGGPLAGELMAHFGNCVAFETPNGTVVRKDHPDSPRKIDGAVSAIIGVERVAWMSANAGGVVY